MEHINEWKVIITGVGAAASAALGWLGWLVVAFVGCMALDWITGTMVAKSKGEWSSSVARQGCWHKIGSAVAVIVALIFDWLIAMIWPISPASHCPLPMRYSWGRWCWCGTSSPSWEASPKTPVPWAHRSRTSSGRRSSPSTRPWTAATEKTKLHRERRKAAHTGGLSLVFIYFNFFGIGKGKDLIAFFGSTG